jgi:hypothetical protein
MGCGQSSDALGDAAGPGPTQGKQPSPQPSPSSANYNSNNETPPAATKSEEKTSIFDFVVLDSRGNEYPLAQHRGKIVAIVNTATA